jgi:hypothetical protein
MINRRSLATLVTALAPVSIVVEKLVAVVAASSRASAVLSRTDDTPPTWLDSWSESVETRSKATRRSTAAMTRATRATIP